MELIHVKHCLQTWTFVISGVPSDHFVVEKNEQNQITRGNTEQMGLYVWYIKMYLPRASKSCRVANLFYLSHEIVTESAGNDFKETMISTVVLVQV